MSELWTPENNPNVITLPYNYTPWNHQVGLWNYFQQDKPGLRGVAVWHRRAGKDISALNILGTKSMQRRGLYWHIFPTYQQGRKIAWDGMTSDGDRFMDSFPPQLIENVNNTLMKVHLKGGSIYQIVGADEPDSLVGTNPVGVILSEWSVYKSTKVWELIQPILEANGGWALFVYTPRGRNHGFDFYEMAKDHPEWYCEMHTIRDTVKPDGSPIISEAQIERIRAEGETPEEIIQQEYYCSFDASLVGAYFGTQMKDAREEGRICRVPYDPFTTVHTCWDIGMDDETAIWFFQEVGNELHWIDSYSNNGMGIEHYASILKQKPYFNNYGTHYAPHDMKVREFGTGKSRYETAMRHGLRFAIVPKVGDIAESINATRQVLPISYIDSEKCKTGIRALNEYTKEYDENKGVYKNKPLHDWTSHWASAMATGALGFKNKTLRSSSETRSSRSITDYDILD